MTLFDLWGVEESPKRLDEARIAIEPLLEESLRGRDPLLWSHGQHLLGTILLRIGQSRGDIGVLRDAEQALRNALAELAHDVAPYWWATTTCDLATTLLELGSRRQGFQKLADALDLFQSLKEQYSREDNHAGVVRANNGIAMALQYIGELHEDGTNALELAISLYEKILNDRVEGEKELYRQIETNHLNALYALKARKDALQQALQVDSAEGSLLPDDKSLQQKNRNDFGAA
jgi:hypothetical protein